MNLKEINYGYYSRKSSESDERQVQSLDTQERVCNGLAADDDLFVALRFSEAKSAKEPGKRPQFNAMIAALKAGRIQGIICLHLNRLARNPDEAGIIIGMLQRGEIRHIKTRERDYYSDDNALLTYLEFGIANQYIRDLSKNVKDGLATMVGRGWRPGSLPPGYLNTKFAERGSNYVLVDEERFPLLRRAWELMLTACYVPEEILEKLNNEWGFRTRPTGKRGGRPLSRSGLYRIFTNPFYAGLIAYGGSTEVGKHQPMITLDEFDRVQIILGRKGKPRPTRHEYAFNGIIRCGECQGFVSATTVHKRRPSGEVATYVFYFCTASRRHTCSQTYTNTTLVEAQIAECLSKSAVHPLLCEWALRIIEEEPDPEHQAAPAIRQAQEKALANAKRQLDILTDLRLRELIDDAEFGTRRPQLKEEIARLELRLLQQSAQEDEELALTAQTFRFATYAEARFRMPDPKVKREILTELAVSSTLKGRQLQIDVGRRFLVFEQNLSDLWQKIEAFEPEKYGSDEWRKAAFAAFRPLVRGLVDAVRTEARRDLEDARAVRQQPHTKEA